MTEAKYRIGDQVSTQLGNVGAVTQVWSDNSTPVYWVVGEKVNFFYHEDALSPVVEAPAEEPAAT